MPLVGLREVHYSRPALVTGTNYGAGPIRGVFMTPPLFGSTPVHVSGGTIYTQAGVVVGNLAGSDRVRAASSDEQMVFVANGGAYVWSQTGFAQINNGTLPLVSDVAYLRGRFIYLAQNSGQFYYSEIDDAANEGGLDFATTESSSDNNIAVAVLNDEAVFFGANTVEFWTVSTDASAPFTPAVGRGIPYGCIARDSVVPLDQSIFWVGDNLTVYRVGPGGAVRISSSSIEGKIRQSTDLANITAWGATFDGHQLYVMNIPGVGTYAYDASRLGAREADRGEWGEWQSFGRTMFRGQNSVTVNGTTWVGDDTTNNLWTMQSGVYLDGGLPLVRVGSIFIKVEEGTPRCNNIVMHGVVGQGNATGPGSDPVVEMRYSDDLGGSFSDWRKASLGKRGAYFQRAFWQRLGSMRAPGRLVEIRVSDPVNAVFSHAELSATRPAV